MTRLVNLLFFSISAIFLTAQTQLDVEGDINISTSNSYKIGNSNFLFAGDNQSVMVGLSTGTTGIFNTFVGSTSGLNNLGDRNTFLGHDAGRGNTSGITNTFVGEFVGDVNTIGSRNTLLGHTANVSSNNLNNAMALGTGAIVDASNKVRIGDANVTVIEGQVDWSFPADRRFKKNVKEDVLGLDLVLKLRPVNYQFDVTAYNAHHGIQNESALTTTHKAAQIVQSGFIAQEVESVLKSINYNFSGLVKPQNKNDNYGLRYGSFVVPLVKAVQEQHELILKQQKDSDDQQLKIEKLESQVLHLMKVIEEIGVAKIE